MAIMSKRQPTVIFLGDGMADEPLPECGGRTPLQAAHTPAMDRIAREGICGSLLTLPEGFPTSSDVANMSVLGCDLHTEFCGRGVLEAASQGIALAPDELAFRVNLVTQESGILTDFSGGHIAQAAAEELVAALQAALGDDTVRFCSGVSYRNLLILKGAGYSATVATEKPDDNQGNRIADHLPQGGDASAVRTAVLLKRLMREAGGILEGHPVNRAARAAGRPPANAIWPWSGGSAGSMRTLADKYGISSAVISAVDVIRGLGRCLGMAVIDVPGATGYIDTNYEGKADAAIEALRHHDLVYVHVEAIDEVSHEQNLGLKLQAIEDFDARLVSRIMKGVPDDVTAVVLPDHPVPIRLGKHTRTPVPVAVRMAGQVPDHVVAFDETGCPGGRLGALANDGLMAFLFGPAKPAAGRGGV